MRHLDMIAPQKVRGATTAMDDCLADLMAKLLDKELPGTVEQFYAAMDFYHGLRETFIEASRHDLDITYSRNGLVRRGTKSDIKPRKLPLPETTQTL